MAYSASKPLRFGSIGGLPNISTERNRPFSPFVFSLSFSSVCACRRRMPSAAPEYTAPACGLPTRTGRATVASLSTFTRNGVNPPCRNTAFAGPRCTFTRNSGFTDTDASTCASRIF